VQGPLSEESQGKPHGEIIRDYEHTADTKWRFGKPNYARVNETYFKHRTKKHAEGSLEAIVSKVVKNWEVESHHISDIKQWKTMDITKFKAAVNGGTPASAQLMCDIGPYNMLLGEAPSWSSAGNTFESANKTWSETFPEGYAWECLEVLAGPPAVTFKWRHFGHFTGTYTDKNGRKYKGNGEMLNLIGLCIAKVNENLVIETLDVYYNPDDLLSACVTKVKPDESQAPVGGDEGDAKAAPGGACQCANGQQGCSVM